MKPEGKIDKKNLSFIVASLLVGILIGASFVYAQSSQILTISQGIYPGAPSYTIWTDGTTYYAKDANGALSFQDTDCTTVFDSCVSTLTNGGTIHFTTGTFDFETEPALIQQQNIVIEGEGSQGGYLPTGIGETILRKRFSGNFLFNFTNVDTDKELHFKIKDLGITSLTIDEYNEAIVPITGGALAIRYGGYWSLENIQIIRFDGSDGAIHIEDTGRGLIKDIIVAEIKNGHGVYLKNLADSAFYQLELDCYGQAVGKAALYIDSGVDVDIYGGHIEGFKGIYALSGFTIHGTRFTAIKERAIETYQYCRIENAYIQSANLGGYTGTNSCAIYSEGTYLQVLNSHVTASAAQYAIHAISNHHTIMGNFAENVTVGDKCSVSNNAQLYYLNTGVECRIIGNSLWNTITNGTSCYLFANYCAGTNSWLADGVP